MRRIELAVRQSAADRLTAGRPERFGLLKSQRLQINQRTFFSAS